LVDIRHKLSIIYTHSQLMHNEQRYLAKTHAISDLPRKKKKIHSSSPPIFFFFL